MDTNPNYDLLLGESEPQGNADTVAESADRAAAELATEALNLRNMSGAGFMYWTFCSSMQEKLNPESFRVYRDLLVQEAGAPKDPIERMLIEQLALAHFNIGQLHIKACSVDNAKYSIAYTDAATRLLGEFRRCSLALEDYRAKQKARQEPPATAEDAKAEKPPTAKNGRFRTSENGKASSARKNRPSPSKVRSSNYYSEIPQCLINRMQPPIPNGSRLAASTNGNGKG